MVDRLPRPLRGKIDDIMSDYHGIDTYVKMDNPYDGIHHIDMHMGCWTSRPCSCQNTLPAWPTVQIEANLQYVVSNFTTKWGTPFNVIRIPSPPEYGDGYPNQGGDYLTYSNATFVNNTILLPTYYQQYDTTAIRIWEEAMPGYNVVGIDCDSRGGPHSFEWRHPLHHPLRRCGRSADDQPPAVERHGRRRQRQSRSRRHQPPLRDCDSHELVDWRMDLDELPMAEVDANDLFATYEASIPALGWHQGALLRFCRGQQREVRVPSHARTGGGGRTRWSGQASVWMRQAPPPLGAPFTPTQPRR